MATYQILYWVDIPVQVRAKGEGGRAKAALHDRFQEAVDLAAMSVGWIGSDEYTDAYHWGDEQTRDGSAASVVDAVVAEIESQHPRVDWRATVASIRAKSEAA
ncbi:virulence factor [Kouleothrix sp.]|uniref:virulence factor n=1 Tax=Kouleothrix sp. TaxID=2779161 RepID=UPI003919CC75